MNYDGKGSRAKEAERHAFILNVRKENISKHSEKCSITPNQVGFHSFCIAANYAERIMQPNTVLRGGGRFFPPPNIQYRCWPGRENILPVKTTCKLLIGLCPLSELV